VRIAERLADVVEEKTLHMVTSDPKRTPTFTMFGNPDFFFSTSNGCKASSSDPGFALCVDYHFAWNHGDIQDEIGNTWLGVVGPGVALRGLDTQTWSDHPDIRPTINSLIGLHDGYQDDGRVITELFDGAALPDDLSDHPKTTTQLGAVYKQVNAPFGAFAMDTLTASTTALKATNELTYDSIESKIANLTGERDLLAGNIRAALNDAAAGNATIDESQAKAWIKQGQSLLDRAHTLASS
jgi:hypothetical protein